MARRSKPIDGLTEREILARLDGGALADEALPLFARLREVVTDASVEPLGRLIAESPDQRIKVASVITLRRLGSEAAVDPLIESLESPDHIVVSFAARALAALGAREAAPALAARLERANGSERDALAYALMKLPHRSAIPALAVTARDTRRGARRLAAIALSRINAPEARSGSEQAVRELPWWQGALRHTPPR